MKSRHAFTGCLVAAMVTFGMGLHSEHSLSAQQTEVESNEEFQVLTRGPVHEAFAETVTFDPQPGVVIPKSPPEPIEELPPDQRPEGENVAWIPGYWAWDDERDDFLWVSGIWRSLPPGRQWVPGYWGQAGQDFQWTSGYWADAQLAEVSYLPEPPASVEAGPNIAAPSPEYIWAPGFWMWNQNRYAWRPGYWIPAQQNWVWIPSHYLWSPRGYVFINGYYDYSVARRGVLFAPVYFNANVYGRRGFTYSPAVAISMAVFGNQLFLRPNYGHYYFGDYYGSGYSNRGFQPWFSINSGRNGYDPFYAQQRWQNRQNGSWARNVQANFQRRVDNEDARPPRTFAAQQAHLKSGDAPNDKDVEVATSLERIAQNKDSSLKLQRITKDEQQSLAKRGQDIRQFRAERQKLESKGTAAPADTPAAEAEPAKLKLPKSPIVAKASEQTGEDTAPPKSQEAPPPDSKIEPKRRKPVVRPETPKDEPKTPKAETRPGTPKGTPKTKPNPDPKSEPAPVEPMPAPKVGPKPERPKPMPKVEPKPMPKVEPMPAPKVEPKPMPKVEPMPAPKVEPMPAPKVEPKPAPKVEPKPMPKVEPKPMPKVEPKPVPPTPSPKVQPQPKPPKTGPKPKPPKEPKKDD